MTRPTNPWILATAAALCSPTGLVLVADIAQELSGALTLPEIHAAILEAYGAGLLELRPEGGLDRLSTSELAAALPGPQGSRLAWVRIP